MYLYGAMYMSIGALELKEWGFECRELNSGPQEKRYMPIATEPMPQPRHAQVYYCLWYW